MLSKKTIFITNYAKEKYKNILEKHLWRSKNNKEVTSFYLLPYFKIDNYHIRYKYNNWYIIFYLLKLVINQN